MRFSWNGSILLGCGLRLAGLGYPWLHFPRVLLWRACRKLWYLSARSPPSAIATFRLLLLCCGGGGFPKISRVLLLFASSERCSFPRGYRMLDNAWCNTAWTLRFADRASHFDFQLKWRKIVSKWMRKGRIENRGHFKTGVR